MIRMQNKLELPCWASPLLFTSFSAVWHLVVVHHHHHPFLIAIVFNLITNEFARITKMEYMKHRRHHHYTGLNNSIFCFDLFIVMCIQIQMNWKWESAMRVVLCVQMHKCSYVTHSQPIHKIINKFICYDCRYELLRTLLLWIVQFASRWKSEDVIKLQVILGTKFICSLYVIIEQCTHNTSHISHSSYIRMQWHTKTIYSICIYLFRIRRTWSLHILLCKNGVRVRWYGMCDCIYVCARAFVLFLHA